jgi:toxin-antitoxin system PIN domain toxin
MRALLDVNVLIALLDANHSLHNNACNWFEENASLGWASCPLTQNGCLRIMAHSGYPNSQPVHAIAERLAEATSQPQHQFWPDDISLLHSDIADATRIHGPRQLTDLYLLALAIRHGGRLVTYDRAIPLNAIHGAREEHLLAL